MSKRSYGESLSHGGSQPPESIDSPHMLPINDLLSPSQVQEQHQQSTASSKKPRNFIATVACETCRLKKTRCDESRPKCGLCKALGLECVYNERKSSKRDHSLSLIMSTLHRLETKLESLPLTLSHDLKSLQGQMLHALDDAAEIGTPERSSRRVLQQAPLAHPLAHDLTPDAAEPDDFEFNERTNTTDPTGQVSISFSQHGVVLWPGARKVLPKGLLEAHEKLGKNYVIDTEMRRPQLPMYICPFPTQAGNDWLEALPLAVVKGLSDAFFATFAPFTPIMDKNFYFALTLGAAIENGFGYTIESCLVLNVMALGCLAVQAHREGNYPLSGTRSAQFEPPEWMDVIHEDPPGLRFFNEARRRIGFLMCDNDLQSCQFYLLSSYVALPLWELSSS
ncbi:hypothetical protein EYZ11_006171 [Aspergillus tanneri]|uniref:Zn(2)-C6 fungal-type domain-containing protein n=1 Tax=Aspergillus tanneri TaxID=1220188 RepID=A0A4S3JGE9_9EURO|nr:hypothetical protein EYZ11_006171 [Aspergillus tanneri]